MQRLIMATFVSGGVACLSRPAALTLISTTSCASTGLYVFFIYLFIFLKAMPAQVAARISSPHIVKVACM